MNPPVDQQQYSLMGALLLTELSAVLRKPLCLMTGENTQALKHILTLVNTHTHTHTILAGPLSDEPSIDIKSKLFIQLEKKTN